MVIISQQINIMKKNLLFVVCSFLLLCVCGRASAAAPVFVQGATQSLSVCSAGYSINTLLEVGDADAGDTETWSVIGNASHGTLVASYTATSTGVNITPSGLSYTPATGYTGMDSFTVMVSDGTDADTTTVYITVDGMPSAGIISGAGTVCVGHSITLSATGTGGVWSSTNGSATVAGGIVTAIHPGIDTIRYRVTNTCGEDTAMRSITIIAAPVAGPISGLTTICAGGTITLTAPTTGGTWIAANGNATVAGGVVTGMTGGVDTITYIVGNACGADTSSVAITVDTAIVLTGAITGADTVCAGAAATYTAVVGGIWTTGVLGTITSGGVFTAGATAGNTIITYSAANSCGSSSLNKTVAIIPSPSAAITGGTSVCIGSALTLTGTASGGVWTSSVPDFAPVSTTGVVFGSLNGGTVISYIVTNACGSDTATQNVVVDQTAQPIAGPTTACQLTLITLTDAVAGGNWSSDNFLVLPILAGNGFGLTPGIANITYTVNNSCGTSLTTLSIEILDCTTAGVANATASTGIISVMPNPSQGTFKLTLPAVATEQANVVVTNMLGAIVKELSITTNTATEVTLDVPAGVYMLAATVKDARYTTRVVVAK